MGDNRASHAEDGTVHDWGCGIANDGDEKWNDEEDRMADVPKCGPAGCQYARCEGVSGDVLVGE